MSEKELAKQIIDSLPDYKVNRILYILKGIQLADDIEDDLFCERLVEQSLNDPDRNPHDTMNIDQVAEELGLNLQMINHFSPTKGGDDMPEISLFYGIRITMYYHDHMPPHFHAEYNGSNALIDIINIQVVKGSLPNRQLRLILAWCTIHQDELMQNWELAKDGKPLNRINPLV